MSEEEYFQERLDDQINWYDKKSARSQKLYKSLKGIVIFLSASIPFFVGFISDFEFWEIVVSAIGVSIAVIEAWLGITKYHEHWIEYRSICETLKHEKYMYLTRTGVYDNENPFKVLVERVESIISKENVNWASLNNIQNAEK
ncbi:hypothetical protein CD30_05905 [Ureibacillus massiliensis 4400831 = CIP 108448 = CCUG 49529]|uniref:DUF4231 domain-containing protein n=1 Tax=Ureibacillus massiliensis 4400831 = CIP 108448 = CCUG 49529 TaxID=1211035 RepID=A0A0A3J6L2_9BACL|nr:hypothetical protein CD30_05905 [Ureibacillus massiliensis 4400831 = CIP 108448 = CCUG 49529]